jgi:hypothetical protein
VRRELPFFKRQKNEKNEFEKIVVFVGYHSLFDAGIGGYTGAACFVRRYFSRGLG